MQDSQYAPETTAPPIGESARSVAAHARAEGERLVETARADLMQVAEQRKVQAGSYLSDISSVLHKGSEELRGKGRDGAAAFSEIAAEELDRLSARVNDHSLSALWHDFEEFAHRRPGLVLGAALLAGFGATRFAMSSKRPRETPGPSHPQQTYSREE